MSVKVRRRIFFEVIAILVLCLFLIITTFSDWNIALEHTNEIELSKVVYEDLLKREKALESEIYKLQDVDYLARYAREKFYFSKDGELIIKFEGE